MMFSLHRFNARLVSFILAHRTQCTCLEQELVYLSCYSDKAMGWTARESGFDSVQGKEILFFFVISILVVQPTLASHSKDAGKFFSSG